MRIAIFDYKIIPTNPVGSCHLHMLRQLCREHDFTVFAAEFENPCPERIRWVRVPVPVRPLAVLFVLYHVVAPVCYWWHRLWQWTRFDLIQIVESYFYTGDVSYAHFCHRAYLKHHWQGTRTESLRRFFNWLYHRLHALMEPVVYRRVKRIVVPSRGLARELRGEYPFVSDKIEVVPNPVDVERMQPAAGFDRDGFRRRLGVGRDDAALVFVALGHFERKGLPLLLEALRQSQHSRHKLLVVGGEADLIAAYRGRVERMGLGGRVIFAGMQRDIRPYLWAADAFAFPSFYETFSLVSFEAAAAGLPLIVTRLHGVEDLIRDGENGLLAERSVEGMAQKIERFAALLPEERRAMGARAQRSARSYDVPRFVSAWRSLYAPGAAVGKRWVAQRQG
jgi:glycosyltransferase involved in cell wall biosynthesis